MTSTETSSPLKVLFICTHNRCRSVLFEAITNQNANGKIIAKSAGSEPAGEVHPLTLKYLTEAGYDLTGISSNSWDDTTYMDGFEPDLLITVCDNAAGETCPIWLGSLPNLVKRHWGLADPSKDTDDTNKTAQNFRHAIATIEQRVETLDQIANLPVAERSDALNRL